MSDLLSYQLFGHCAFEQDLTQSDMFEPSSTAFAEPTQNISVCDTFSSISTVECSLSDVDLTSAFLDQSNGVGIDEGLCTSQSDTVTSVTLDDQQHSDGWGFMLSDTGGMITFDDDNGAADWGFDDGISANADF